VTTKNKNHIEKNREPFSSLIIYLITQITTTTTTTTKGIWCRLQVSSTVAWTGWDYSTGSRHTLGSNTKPFD